MASHREQREAIKALFPQTRLNISATDLWGRKRPVERAGINPDPRTITPFAVELRRELDKAAAIRRDPFKHLPASLMPPSWTLIVLRTSKNVRPHYLNPGSPQYTRLWGANK